MRARFFAAFLMTALLLTVSVSYSFTGGDHPPGPHGGIIEDLGTDGKFHTEFVRDKDKKDTVWIYILGADEKTAAPVKTTDKLLLSLLHLPEPVHIPLKSSPQEKDPEGKTSRFTATHEKLVGKVKARVSGPIDGKVRQSDKAFSEK